MAPDVYDTARHDSGARRHLDLIRRVTGSAPPTCPWRAMYAPIVREVIAAMEHEEHGNLAVGIGADPPAILVDAIGAYKTALEAVRSEDRKLAYEKSRRERPQS